MVELRSEPYTLKTRPDVIDTEQEFRDNLNPAGINGAHFNVVASKNSAVLAKYDTEVVPLDDLSKYQPKYSSAYLELDNIDKLISKYTRTENPAELNRNKIVTELNNLKAMITQNI